MPQFSVKRYNDAHFQRTEAYVKKVRNIYYAAIREAVRLGVTLGHDPSKPFYFADFPAAKARLTKIFDEMSEEMEYVITEGIEKEWEASNLKNDDFLSQLFKMDSLPDRAVARLMGRNQEALKAFKARKRAGLKLSDRVWRLTTQFKSEIELALELGISDGRSADQISQDIRMYLDNPNMLFRRVRDERGVLRLSKHAKAYNPGQGIYRSSYKNAQRVARTEVNTAYRTADHERWQKFDFIVGIEVRRSQNRVFCDVCDSLVGKYPKDYKFYGFHPNCRCFAVPILATDPEINDMERLMLNGHSTEGFRSVNAVNYVNPGFTEWVRKNDQRLLRAKALPFFLSENPVYYQNAKIIR